MWFGVKRNVLMIAVVLVAFSWLSLARLSCGGSPASGACTATVDGKKFSGRGAINPQSTSFWVDCSEGSRQGVTLVVPMPPHVGAYPLGGREPAYAEYKSWKPTLGFYTTQNPAASGTLTISAWDPSNKTVAGTFSFSAPTNGVRQGGPAVVNLEGSFDARAPTQSEEALSKRFMRVAEKVFGLFTAR